MHSLFEDLGRVATAGLTRHIVFLVPVFNGLGEWYQEISFSTVALLSVGMVRSVEVGADHSRCIC